MKNQVFTLVFDVVILKSEEERQPIKEVNAEKAIGHATTCGGFGQCREQ